MRLGRLLCGLTLALAMACTAASQPAPPGSPAGDVDQQLGATRAAAAASGDHAGLMQAELQIARQEGLRGRFDAAKATLAQVAAELRPAETAAHAGYELELGRLIRTEGDPVGARPHFEKALAIAEAARLDDLAVDAAHMLAIIGAGPAQQIARGRAAIALAEQSAQPKARAWLPLLWNNLAAAYEDAGRYREALGAYAKARAGCGDDACALIADWKLARVRRELGDYAEALGMLSALEQRYARLGPRTQPAFDDGDGVDYVHEEMGRDHLALARAAPAGAAQERALAKRYFAQAYAELAAAQKTQGAVAADLSDAARLQALKKLAE